MSKAIVNLAMSFIAQIAEEILLTYPAHSYQHTFAEPGMRQKLITYVLCRTPGFYTVIEESEACAIATNASCCSPEQRQQIAKLVHQGIHSLTEEDAQRIQHHIAQIEDSNNVPSSWFG
jgi:hypothetical protein